MNKYTKVLGNVLVLTLYTAQDSVGFKNRY